MTLAQIEGERADKERIIEQFREVISELEQCPSFSGVHETLIRLNDVINSIASVML